MARGYSLIEVLTVMALSALLFGLAYPNYQQSLIKSQRVEAQLNLLKLANRLEEGYAKDNRYQAIDLSSLNNPHHRFSLPELSDSAYRLQATATNDPTCPLLSLDDRGMKGPTVACWL
jgi:type IV pilus assembly protein PilE